MKLNLDDILAIADPDPIVLTLGGIDYTVKELDISEVIALDGLTTKNNAEITGFLSSLFVGGAPPQMQMYLDQLTGPDTFARQRLFNQITLIMAAIKIAVAEREAKKMKGAPAMIAQQVRASLESGSSPN